MKKLIKGLLGVSLLLTGCSSTSKEPEASMSNEEYVENFKTLYHQFYNQDYVEYAIQHEYSEGDSDFGLYMDYISDKQAITMSWAEQDGETVGSYIINDGSYMSTYISYDGTFELLGSTKNDNWNFDFTEPFNNDQWEYDESKTDCNDETYIFYFNNTVKDSNITFIELEVHVKDEAITDYVTYTYTDDYKDGKEVYATTTVQLITNTPSKNFDQMQTELLAFEGQEVSAMDDYKPFQE